MTNMDKDIMEFENLLNNWIEAYRWKDCSYLAIKTPDGPRLLFGRVIVDKNLSSQSNLDYRFESDHIKAGRAIVKTSVDDIATLIAEAKKGEITAFGEKLSLIKERNDLNTFFSPIYHPLISFGPRFPSLRISGLSKSELLTKTGDIRLLDWELKAADAPFDNLDELLGFLDLPNIGMGDFTMIELVARSPTLISESSIIEDSQATIKCQASSSIDIKNVKLGYKIFHKNSVGRSSLMGESIEWKIDGDLQLGSVTIPVGDAQVMQAFLSYKGIALHQWWVSDPKKHLNPRFAIHQTFDEKLDVIKEFLFEKKETYFEQGIAMLLNILGFSISHYGHIPKTQKGPDIVAITPWGQVGVIECTIGLLNAKDKLSKLVQRTTLIKERLQRDGFGHLQVQPVIVSAMTRNEVSAHLEEANKKGIAVVCKEDLENMLNQINFAPNPDRLFQEAVKSASGTEQRSLF